MPRQKKYAKMTISGAVICYAYTRKEASNEDSSWKEAAKRLDCKLSEVYLYQLKKEMK